MRNIFIAICLFTSSVLMSQETQQLSIFKNGNNWNKEIINFPIEWAPNLTLTGFEEILFSPNWNKPKSDDFWSLIIGWKVKAESELSLKEIKSNLTAYFDGLMKPNHWAKHFPSPKIVLKVNKQSKNNFYGKMEFFDGFHTGKVMLVNLKVKQHFCDNSGLSVLVFQLSPKKDNTVIWKTLSEIDLIATICK